MFMQNIPRRKVYETLLELEGKIIEIQILSHSQKKFNQYKKIYGKPTIEKIKELITKIKALLIMFFDGKKYQKEQDYLKDLELFEKTPIINSFLTENKNLSKNFKKLITNLDNHLKKTTELKNHSEAKELFLLLDDLNIQIPKILEIRRDQMK